MYGQSERGVASNGGWREGVPKMQNSREFSCNTVAITRHRRQSTEVNEGMMPQPLYRCEQTGVVT
jgi:hypothetical protein